MKLFSLSIALAATLTFSATAQVGQVEAPLLAGTEDADTPAANATVWANGCTGTLVTPDTVVSAGHCFGQRANPQPASGLPCADVEVPGRWYPVSGTITVLVGNDRTSPRFRTIVTDYTLPGCADIFVLRLRDPVPPEHATPVKVLTRLGEGNGAEPSAFFEGQSFRAAGWGLDTASRTPTIRQTTTMQHVRNDDSMIFVRGAGGSITAAGDSGGPLYWTHPSGRQYLVGVLQGPTPGANENRYTPTYRNPKDGVPGVGGFFEAAMPEAVSCDSPADRPAGTLPLVAWWSGDRADNFATTNRAWIGCTGARRSPDYGYVRIEGYIFNPEAPQPRGTVRLYSWYDPDRGDNAAQSHPVWIHWEGDGGKRSPNYGLSRLEGYVFDPARQQPSGTVPLYRWFSSGRGDNWTTTQFPEQGGAESGLDPDYGFSALVGYVFPARVQ